MTETFLKDAWHYIDRLEFVNTINLFDWTKDIVTRCSTRAIYGPRNPFSKNPKFVRLFWDFDQELNLLIADILPSFLAPAGYKARSEIAAAFTEYYKDYDTKETQSSAMIEARYRTNMQYGLSYWNQGCLEVGTLLGILASTIPSSFYMLVRLYADPVLLEDVRAEVMNVAVKKLDDGLYVIDVMAVRDSCRLLDATWQELLRVHALGVGSRYVREDVLLNDQYRLENGRVVQMPMAVLHSDPAVWGSDAREFQPRRFLKGSDGTKGAKTNPSGHRPFGGSASLCPGRHFVGLEVTALAACIIMRFDVTPVEGDWRIPVQKQESMATNVFPPKSDMRVKVTKRRGYENANWEFKIR
ncbi:MAG: hypothetical protein Q9213_005121 [Squamulea squamosa]